ESVTANPDALEGNRPTLVILNEIQWWREDNRGTEMYQTIVGNQVKRATAPARYLAISNAHRPGVASVGARPRYAHRNVLAGEAIDVGSLYDALEAPADTPISEIPNPKVDPDGFENGLEKLKDGLRIARGDSHWLDIDGTVAAILNRSNVISES